MLVNFTQTKRGTWSKSLASEVNRPAFVKCVFVPSRKQDPYHWLQRKVGGGTGRVKRYSL